MTTDSLTSSADKADNAKTRNESDKEEKLTPYEKVCSDVNNDERYLKELALGKRIGFYRIRGELGTGNFSRVKMGIHALTKDKVAIKILDKTKLDGKTQRLLSREISSMENLHHPNVIRLYEVIETLTKLHIIMEFANGGELFTKISSEGKFSEKISKRIFAQIIAGLDHMHKQQIIHRDLKAENIFLNDHDQVKIGDFGFSTSAAPDAALNTFCGSPPYAAPELFKDECYYGTCVDIWAVGVLLYFMVTGIMPFRAETVGKLKKCILDGVYFMPDFLTENCRSLIRRILKLLPQDRLTMEDIRNSKWLQGESFPEEDTKRYISIPDSQLCTEDEREARHLLDKLGVPTNNSDDNTDARNSITGTYRVLLHRIQKQRDEQEKGMAKDKKDVVRLKHEKQMKSKFCSIL